MKKVKDELKSEIRLLKLGEMSIFKENKDVFDDFKNAIMKKYNVSDNEIKRELKKLDKENKL